MAASSSASAAAPVEMLPAWASDNAALLRVAGASAVLGYGLYALLRPSETGKGAYTTAPPLARGKGKAVVATATAVPPALDASAKQELLASLEKEGGDAFLAALGRYDAEAARVFLAECGEHVRARLAVAADAVLGAAKGALHLNLRETDAAAAAAPVVTTADAATLVARVAYGCSDVVFAYTSGTADAAVAALEAWAAAGRHNARAHLPTVKSLAVRAGAGTAVAGALLADTGARRGSGHAVTVLVPSQALPTMAPALHAMAAASRAVVVHVPLIHVGAGLCATLDEAPLALAKDSGFCVLAASCAQDAADLALVAHALAVSAELPVLHVYDGLRLPGVLQRLEAPLDPAFADGGRGEASVALLLASVGTADADAADSGPGSGTVTPRREPRRSATARRVIASVQRALAAVQSHTGRPQAAFSYHGSLRATAVLVVLAPLAPAFFEAADAVNAATIHGHRVGVVAVRVLRPWSNADFCRVLPRGTKRLTVLEAGAQAQGSLLLSDVAAAFYSAEWTAAGAAAPVLGFGRVVVDARGVTPAMAREAFDRLVTRGADAVPASDAAVSASASTAINVIRHPAALGPLDAAPTAPTEARRLVTLWQRSAAGDAGDAAALVVAAAVSPALGLRSAAHTSADAYAAGGLARTEVAAAPKADVALSVAAAGASAAHLAVVADVAVLAAVRDTVVRQLLPGGTLLFLTAAPESDALAEALGSAALAALRAKRITLRALDVRALATAGSSDDAAVTAGTNGSAPSAELAAALPLILAALAPSGTKAALAAAQHALRAAAVSAGASTQATDALVRIASAAMAAGAVAVPLPEVAPETEAADSAAAVAAAAAPSDFVPRVALPALPPSTGPAAAPRAVRRAEVAWRMLYSDVYGSERNVRPGHHEVYRVKLTRNERLTPLTYERNVFHLEMDTRGTGLTYRIGDALGVYAHNDAAETADFIASCGFNASDAISVEHPDQPDRRELLTVSTLFRERLDVFGKPSQKFYEALAPFAADSYQRAKLEWLGTEDKEGFRLRQFETFTFADVLAEFDSARPPLHVLAALIPAIKPRHYSIASSINMCPDSVHLLVVLVDWTTPKGRKRYGQCTRYLANLRPEDEPYLSVDIKPSVMHLPPSPSQPVIMAGLGTGMAPFRAFLQEREWQRRQGVEVGPMVLYFGARHRSEEYLYGDYLDAMHAEGLITTLGLAFSRDQKDKVYIQHKIEGDRALISRYLNQEKGHFYLCGPTWPVPDVKNAILGGVRAETGMDEEASEEWLEQLKEEGRYVLEVY